MAAWISGTTSGIRSRPYLCSVTKMNQVFLQARQFGSSAKMPSRAAVSAGNVPASSPWRFAFSGRARNSSSSPAASLLADDSDSAQERMPPNPHFSRLVRIGLIA